MKILVALACLLAGCLAQKPHPCESPPLMTGALTVSTQNEKLWVYAKYLYDALGRRLRMFEFGTLNNKTFTADYLLLYREQVFYEINHENRTCKKSPLKIDFVPIGVPEGATLLGQGIVGSSSGPGQGLLVNTWWGDLPTGGNYMSTVTEFGCIPVSVASKTQEYGWMVLNYFNNVIGITDPNLLNPPEFCPSADAAMIGNEKPVDFFSLFADKF
ncbi:ependymin-like [Cheilinus undulatus]|uniref:ependymin-like n=1 Tax=Cheilinus undulatus TaxID=241271 RepID=UPI001BD233A4|nr:ependymin-like [Cheilinus undulatus]